MPRSRVSLSLAVFLAMTVSPYMHAQNYSDVAHSDAATWQATANSYYSAQHFDEASASAYFESNDSFSCRWETKTSCSYANLIIGQYHLENGHCGEGSTEHSYFSLASQATTNAYLRTEYSLDLTELPPWVEHTFLVVSFTNGGLFNEQIQGSTLRSTGVGLGYTSRVYGQVDQFTLRHSANGDLFVRRHINTFGGSESYAHCVPRR